jgi:pimeloyl-ACP methyl ester carboxylesterase
VAKRRTPPPVAAAPPVPPAAPAAAATAGKLPEASYAPALNAGLQATATRVQEMHEAIAGKTFDNLMRVPGLGVPTRIVQSVHDAVTQGVYAAVRHGGSAVLTLAAGAERLATDPNRIPGGKEQLLRSALNGAVGDALAASANPLAVQMAFHADGAPLLLTQTPLKRASLAPLHPQVCVFIHGLACDEGSWGLRTDAWSASPWAHTLAEGITVRYGTLLESELGLSALYLRYNTGLPIEANAQQFAALLDDLLKAAPQVSDLVLVGHSMGGLVARRALAIATEGALEWAPRTSMMICLGSPNQGAALAKIGAVASAALMATDVTRPLGRIADARSQGVKDLRKGMRLPAQRSTRPEALAVPVRLVYATLGDDAGSAGGKLMGKLFGDGLVHPGSASDDGLTGDVERVEVTGLGHMGLLNHPRVYVLIRRWLGAAELA